MSKVSPPFLRPSVRAREFDLTTRGSSFASTYAAVTGAFTKGPLKPTYISGNLQKLYSLYGEKADPTLSFAHDTAQAAATQTGNLLINRVVNGALHSGVHIFHDNFTTPAAPRPLFVPFVLGKTDGYEEGIKVPDLLVFDDVLVTLNTFNMSISDGVTSTPISEVTFATSHAATMTAIASAITTTLATFGNNGSATVVQDGDLADNLAISIVAPDGVTLSYLSPTVAAGATQAGAVIKTANSAHMFSVQAENPGTWGNDVGIKIANIRKGTRARKRLLFSDKLVSLNTFNLNINGTAISQVTFATDSDTTMAAIATAIKAHADVSDAYVETVVAGLENDRSIIIVAEDPGPDTLTVTGAVVASGASQAAVAITNVLNGADSTGEFDLQVYYRTNVSTPTETFTATMERYTDGMGVQRIITDVVNEAGNNSINIRVHSNSRFLTDTTWAAAVKADMAGLGYTVSSLITWLTGGDDGSTLLSSNLRTGWQKLNNRVNYPVNMLLNAGYTAVEVQQEMIALAEARGDCTAILDLPSNYQKAQDARDYRNNTMNIDSSYGAVYTPDVMIADISSGERRYIPPSGLIAAAYAYNDRVAADYFSPAGLNRGRLKQALGLRQDYTHADEELMFPVGINPIVNRPGGPVIMGAETLQVKQSILRNVHARRLLNRVKTTIVDGLDYTIFQPNTEFTRNQVLQLGRDVLEPLAQAEALYGYRQQCNDDNNPPELIDEDVLSYRLYLKIARTIKGILLDIVLTRTGASFTEIEAEFNF